MSLASSRVGLRHLCTIERDANAGTPDTWGDAGTPDWQTLAADVPCRAWSEAGREAVSEDRTVVVVDRRVTVPVGTDVTERDRIAGVTDRAGTTILEGPMNVEAVLRYTDHVELILERVR